MVNPRLKLYRGKRVLGTTHRGKTPITSERELRYMHEHKIDHTHFTIRKGKVVKRSRHFY